VGSVEHSLLPPDRIRFCGWFCVRRDEIWAWNGGRCGESASRRSGGRVLLLALLVSSALLNPSLLLANLHSVLVVPLFEEAIFRGWGWSKLERSLPGRLAGFLTYLVMTSLFALWHLGYGDVVYLRGLESQAADPPLRVILFYKVLVGGAVGFGRLRAGDGKTDWPSAARF